MSISVATEIDLNSQLVLDNKAVSTLFLDARTANSWSDEEISDETLQAIYELTKMGPTAFNSQPLRITWLRSTESRERLVPHLMDGNKEKTRTAPMVAILSFTNEWHSLMPTTAPHMADSMMEMFEGNLAGRNAMGSSNAHLQAGYFIMAARAAGLTVGPMTGINPAGIDAEFNADSSHSVIMVVNLGKPGAPSDRDRLPRLDFDLATDIL